MIFIHSSISNDPINITDADILWRSTSSHISYIFDTNYISSLHVWNDYIWFVHGQVLYRMQSQDNNIKKIVKLPGTVMSSIFVDHNEKMFVICSAICEGDGGYMVTVNHDHNYEIDKLSCGIIGVRIYDEKLICINDLTQLCVVDINTCNFEIFKQPNVAHSIYIPYPSPVIFNNKIIILNSTSNLQIYSYADDDIFLDSSISLHDYKIHSFDICDDNVYFCTYQGIYILENTHIKKVHDIKIINGVFYENNIIFIDDARVLYRYHITTNKLIEIAKLDKKVWPASIKIQDINTILIANYNLNTLVYMKNDSMKIKYYDSLMKLEYVDVKNNIALGYDDNNFPMSLKLDL